MGCFVGILWQRFGTPSGANDPQTGLTFDSGTDEEFTLAYKAYQNNDRPQILFYRCNREVGLDQLDPDQLTKLKTFFGNFAANKKHPGLPQDFKTTEELEQRVRQDLTKFLFNHRKLHCALCHGTRAKSLGNYLFSHQNKPRLIENVPTEVCQQCSEYYFDAAMIEMFRKVDWNSKEPQHVLETLVYDFSTLILKPNKG